MRGGGIKKDLFIKGKNVVKDINWTLPCCSSLLPELQRLNMQNPTPGNSAMAATVDRKLEEGQKVCGCVCASAWARIRCECSIWNSTLPSHLSFHKQLICNYIKHVLVLRPLSDYLMCM